MHEVFCSESPREARKFAAFCDCRMVSVVGGRDAEQQAKWRSGSTQHDTTNTTTGFACCDQPI